MKILHLINDLGTGGTETMLYKLLTQMDGDKYENVVVSMIGKGTRGEKIESLGIRLHTLGLHKSLFSGILTFFRLIKVIRKEKPDVIQSWLYHSDMAALLASKLCGDVPNIWNLRCTIMSKQDYPITHFWLLKFLSALSSIPYAVISNSEAAKYQHIAYGYHPVRWETIPNGFNLDLYKPDETLRKEKRGKLKIPDSARVVGLVARYHPMKNHTSFLNAAQRLHKVYPDAFFVMVGKKINEQNIELAEQISELGLSDRILMLGELQDTSLIIPLFDVLSLSSSYGESFPNVIGEAMACGVPCVVTNVGDSAYIIGQYGEVVQPNDDEALANAWLKMLTMDEGARNELGLACRGRICDLFSLSVITSKYEQLYSEIEQFGPRLAFPF